jgi:hypothetical protein
LMNQLVDQNWKSHYLIQDHNLCYIKTIIRINRMARPNLLWFVGIWVSIDHHPFIIHGLSSRIICTGNLDTRIRKRKQYDNVYHFRRFNDNIKQHWGRRDTNRKISCLRCQEKKLSKWLLYSLPATALSTFK